VGERKEAYLLTWLFGYFCVKTKVSGPARPRARRCKFNTTKHLVCL